LRWLPGAARAVVITADLQALTRPVLVLSGANASPSGACLAITMRFLIARFFSPRAGLFRGVAYPLDRHSWRKALVRRQHRWSASARRPFARVQPLLEITCACHGMSKSATCREVLVFVVIALCPLVSGLRTVGIRLLTSPVRPGTLRLLLRLRGRRALLRSATQVPARARTRDATARGRLLPALGDGTRLLTLLTLLGLRRARLALRLSSSGTVVSGMSGR